MKRLRAKLLVGRYIAAMEKATKAGMRQGTRTNLSAYSEVSCLKWRLHALYCYSVSISTSVSVRPPPSATC